MSDYFGNDAVPGFSGDICYCSTDHAPHAPNSNCRQPSFNASFPPSSPYHGYGQHPFRSYASSSLFNETASLAYGSQSCSPSGPSWTSCEERESQSWENRRTMNEAEMLSPCFEPLRDRNDQSSIYYPQPFATNTSRNRPDEQNLSYEHEEPAEYTLTGLNFNLSQKGDGHNRLIDEPPNVRRSTSTYRTFLEPPPLHGHFGRTEVTSNTHTMGNLVHSNTPRSVSPVASSLYSKTSEYHSDDADNSGYPCEVQTCKRYIGNGGIPFPSKKGLWKHTQRVHNTSSSRVHKCELTSVNGERCEAGFKMEKDLRRHIKTVHRKNRDFVCRLCQDVAFKRKDHIKRHLCSQHLMHASDAERELSDQRH